MSKKVEHRSVVHEFRVSDENGSPKIVGYATKFGVRSQDLGGWVEVIAPGAFDECLANNPDVRALFNHNPSAILGRTVSGTLRLSVDDTGLSYEVEPPDTQLARDLVVSMKRGDVNQSSFGFVCQDAAWGFDEVAGVDIRTVKKAELFDVSPVTYPAYLDATSGVRSLPGDMPQEVRSRIGAKRPPKEKRVDPDDDGACQCDCDECQAGNCSDCSDPDCDCPDCHCGDEDRSLRNADEGRRLAIRRGMIEAMQDVRYIS